MENETVDLCKDIQNNINKLCPTEIDEIFKILHKNNSAYTQNNNGVFVNLSWVDSAILHQIHDYILFCLRSQTEINKYEIMKNLISDTINCKDKNDDKIYMCSSSSNVSNLNIGKHVKISSSMKFYLLKKKFQKKYTINQNSNNNINNILTHDEYVKSNTCI